MCIYLLPAVNIFGMPGWLILTIAVIYVVGHFLLEWWIDKEFSLDKKIDDYNGIKDDEETDGFLPW